MAEKTPKKQKTMRDFFTSPTKLMAEASLCDKNVEDEPQNIPTSENLETNVRSVALPVVVPNDLGSINSGPMRPVLISYPKNDKNRSFLANWYANFSWLEYSVHLDRAFCYPCRLYSTSTKSNPSFTKDGYNGWSKAMAPLHGFKKHNASEDHLLAAARWESIITQQKNPAQNIENILDPDRLTIVENNREYMLILLQYHIYFCSQEMPYRGHDESESSLNAGKWKEFVKLSLNANPKFASLHDQIQRSHKTVDYTSKKSCIELIRQLASAVRLNIITQIEKSAMYSILIDECKDSSGHEELGVCFRYVNSMKGTVEERFDGITRLAETDAQNILDCGLQPILDELQGTSAVCLALAADGASVMKGSIEGVAAKLRRKFPWLIFIHCAAHRINLVLSKYLAMDKDSKTVLNVYKALHNIFLVAKNREIFEKCQSEIYPGERAMSISSLCETRWSCSCEGTKTMIRKIKALLSALEIIANSKSPMSEQSASIYHKFMSTRFIAALCFLHNILSIFRDLSLTLQEKQVCWITVQSEVKATKDLLSNLDIHSVIALTKTFCADINIPYGYEDPIFKLSKAKSPNTIEEFCNNLKQQAIITINHEIERRFNTENINILTALDGFDASSTKYLNFEVLKPLMMHYESALNIDEDLFLSECKKAKFLVSNGDGIDISIYPNLKTMSCIYKSLPVGTASVERSFSVMNRILSWAPKFLDSTLASDLMLLSMNRDILKALDLNRLLDKWAREKSRKLKFI